MKRPNAVVVVVITVIAVAIWYGGKIPIGIAPANAPLAAFLLERAHPWLAQAILGVLIAGAIVAVSIRRSVHLVPTRAVGICFLLAWFWILLSAFGSRHLHASFVEVSRWTLLFVWVQVLLSSVGRERYVLVVLATIIAFTALVAISGVQEYLSPSVPQNWRIFAGWHHPNAAASMFALTLPCALALALYSTERSAKILSSLAFALIAVALWLTASKGGLASAVFGLCVLGLLIAFYRVGNLWSSLTAIVVLGVLMLSVHGLKAATSSASQTSSRLTATRQESEQSLAFRKQVWHDTVYMIQQTPLFGTGPGTYSAEFKKYSQVQAPVLAHNSYLQMAAESGVLASLFLLAGFALAVCHIIRRNPVQTREQCVLRLGCAASLCVAGANAMVDSTFSVYGYAVIVFAILSVGLLLSADGAQADKVPMASRVMAMSIPSIVASAYLLTAALSMQLASSAYAQARETGQWTLRAHVSPLDPVPYDLKGQFLSEQGIAPQAVVCFSRAKFLDPTPSRYAALAEALDASGEHRAAVRELLNAHDAEPANPRWLALLLNIERKAGHLYDAERIARDLVAMEGSLFFRLRSLPWLVDLNTLDAHLFLAERAAERHDADEQILHLRAAYDLLREYRLKTATELLRQTGLYRAYEVWDRIRVTKNGFISSYEIADELGVPPEEFREYVKVAEHTPLAGETVAKAIERSRQLYEVAKELSSLLSRQGKGQEGRQYPEEAIRLLLIDFESAWF